MLFTQNDYYQKTFKNLTGEKEIINDIDFEDCQFINCRFFDCQFVKCRFITCSFSGCILSAVVLTGSSFLEPKFTDSKVIGIDWTKTSQFQNPVFQNCQINLSNFTSLKIPDTKIIGCEAKEVDFIETDLSKSDLTGTDFAKSVFSKTNLAKANLTDAKNYYLDPRSCHLKATRLSMPEALVLLKPFGVVIEE